MSLLIKALEQAAKDRKAARADAEKASSEAEQSKATSSEPTLEPPPPRRASARPTPDPAPASPGTQLSLDPSSPASTPRAPAPAAAAPPPRPPPSAEPAASARRAPTSLAGLANTDAQQERARAAAVMQASGNPAGQAIAWLRGNPVMLIAGLAVLFGVAFGVYVYLQVSHPGMFVRQAATKPQDAAPPAPPGPPASAPQPPGLPETAGPGTGQPAVPIPAPPGTQPVAPAGTSGAVASATQTPASPPQIPASAQPIAAPSGAPPSAPLPSSSVIGAAPTSEFPRTPPSERVTEARRERGSIRPPAAGEPGEAPAAPSKRASAAPAGPEPGRDGIRVSQTAVQPRLNPQLSQAYTSLQSGNVEEARGLYNRVVQAEPLNVDALLGLAYIAAQENRADDASKYYLRILQLNPRHAVAQAALIGLMGRADPAASESRLRQLIAREPSPFLHFVLGNLYADQSQWPQAQQSYFQAHHLEPDNPDYAYNLAVGLDHLRQGKLALNFYRRADQLASMQGRSNFNLSHARERIRILASQVE